MIREFVEDLNGNPRVKKFFKKHLPKNLSTEDFLAKNHSKRLSDKFRDIKKQPFGEAELEKFLVELNRRSQAVSTLRDSAHDSRYSAKGSRDSAYDSRYSAHDSRFSAQCACDSAFNSRGTTLASSRASDVIKPIAAQGNNGRRDATLVAQPAQQLGAPPPILNHGAERQGSNPQQLPQPLDRTGAPHVAEEQRPPQPNPSPPPSPPAHRQPQQSSGRSYQNGLLNIVGNGSVIQVSDNAESF